MAAVISTIINSFFSSCTYLLEENTQHLLIDCGDIDSLVKYAESISHVFLTHAHFDHIYGLNKLAAISDRFRVYTTTEGREMLLNAKKNLSYFHGDAFTFNAPERIATVTDGEKVPINDTLTAKAFFTPGHNPSCITWVIEDLLFTGDSLIPGVKTVTNLPGGNKQQAAESISKIRQLQQSRIIYPGHPDMR